MVQIQGTANMTMLLLLLTNAAAAATLSGTCTPVWHSGNVVFVCDNARFRVARMRLGCGSSANDCRQ
jgi:hypothetical protein